MAFINSPGQAMGQFNGKGKKVKRAPKASGKYAAVRVGGRKYSASGGFGQFKTKPAAQKTTAEKLSGGVRLAIL